MGWCYAIYGFSAVSFIQVDGESCTSRRNMSIVSPRLASKLLNLESHLENDTVVGKELRCHSKTTRYILYFLSGFLMDSNCPFIPNKKQRLPWLPLQDGESSPPKGTANLPRAICRDGMTLFTSERPKSFLSDKWSKRATVNTLHYLIPNENGNFWALSVSGIRSGVRRVNPSRPRDMTACVRDEVAIVRERIDGTSPRGFWRVHCADCGDIYRAFVGSELLFCMGFPLRKWRNGSFTTAFWLALEIKQSPGRGPSIEMSNYCFSL